jgi:hypothetical protein
MAKHIGRQTISFEKTIMIGGEYAIAGKEESEGPLGAILMKSSSTTADARKL